MPLAAALPAIAAIGTVAGTALSIAGNVKSQNAMNAARANETNQQAQIQKQSNAIFKNSLAQSTPNTAQQQMQAGQAARTNAWQNLQDATTPTASALPATSGTTTSGTGSSGSATSSSPTSGAGQRAASAGNTWNALNAKSAATEGSYGDWQNQQAIKNASAAQQLGVQNNFSQGDAALLPTELDVASHQGDALSGWGSIVSSLGNLAGYANKFGSFGPKTTSLSQIGNYPGTVAMLSQPGIGISNNTMNDLGSMATAESESTPAARFANGGSIWNF